MPEVEFTYIGRTTAGIMLDAELVWTRYTNSLSKCLTLVALLTAFITMFLSALQNTWEVSNDRIIANKG